MMTLESLWMEVNGWAGDDRAMIEECMIGGLMPNGGCRAAVMYSENENVW